MLYATHARVHLDNIVANLQAVKARVGDRAVLLAIKANAYGHGAVPVAQAVERAGAADWFGVATVPEGVELRQAGIRLPILKLSQVFEDELPEAVRAGLVLTVVDEATVLAAERVAAAQGVTAEVHVKVDTGMRRIGVEPDRAAGLARVAEDQPHLALTGIFTHLPASDEPEQDAFTASQLVTFGRVVDEVTEAIVVLRSADGVRRVRFNEFYTGYRRTVMRPDELVAAIEIPPVDGQQWFRKVGTRAAQAISKIVMAAVRAPHPRIALGSVAPTVVRAVRTEEVLAAGGTPDEAAVALLGEIAPIDDIRSTAEYRRRVACNLLRAFWTETA